MRLASVLGWSLLALACTPAPKAAESAAPAALSAADIAAVQAVDAAFAAGMNAKDTNAVVALYTEDAKLMPPDAPIIEGPALRATFVSLISGGATNFALTPLHTQGVGDLAYTVGTASFDMGGKTEHIKYAVVFRKGADGRWRMAVDIFNGVPAPAPAAAK